MAGGKKPRTGIYKHCETCGKEFYVPHCHARQKFCSADCMAESYRLPLKNCANCGKQFKPIYSTQICCTRKCGTDYQDKKITKTCEQCGKEYQVKQHRSDISRFCSASCKGKWNIQVHPMQGPSLIGNTYRKGLRPTNAFTPEQVRGENNPKWVEPVELACIQCNKVFYRKPHEMRGKHKGIFCSVDCRVEYFKEHYSGEDSPHWVGGIQTYRGRNWKRLRLLAVERDNGTCQKCGKVVGKSIPVHHKRPFREFATVEEANHLDNLTCLCQPCHMKTEPRANRLPSERIQHAS